MTSTHGGPRQPGPGKRIGRPPDPHRKQTACVRLSPDVLAFLRETGNVSVAIETVVRKTAAFKRFDQA